MRFVLFTFLFLSMDYAFAVEPIVCIKSDGNSITIMKTKKDCTIKEVTAQGKVVTQKNTNAFCDTLISAYSDLKFGKGCK